jgi:hypothetical protein
MFKDYSALDIEQLAARIDEKFKSYHIHSALVGDACLSIYTKDHITTNTLQYVILEKNHNHTKKALMEMNFHEEDGIYVNETTPFSIELLNEIKISDVAVDHFQTHHFEEKTITLLSVEDLFKAKLLAYFLTQDPNILDQLAILCQFQTIDLKAMRGFAEQEKIVKAIDLLEERLV